MAKKKSKRQPTSFGSGEMDLESPPLVMVEVDSPSTPHEPVKHPPSPLLYINNAVPRLRASLVSTSTLEGDPGDLEVLKQILKKDRIKSNVYELDNNEAIIADAFKGSCAIIVNSPTDFKEVAIRAFLSGRYVITWGFDESSGISDEERDYYHSEFCLHLKNISQVPSAVRYIKTRYTEQKIKEIREFVLGRVSYE